MNNKFIIVAIASVLLFSCNKKTETQTTTTVTDEKVAVDKEQVKKEIQALEDGLSASINARNTDGMTNFYAEDARTYAFGRPISTGKASIIEDMKKDFSTMPAGTKISFTIKDIIVADDGSQAVEVGAYQLADAKGSSMSTGHYFGFFEKREGKYICVREMITPNTPIKENVIKQ